MFLPGLLEIFSLIASGKPGVFFVLTLALTLTLVLARALVCVLVFLRGLAQDAGADVERDQEAGQRVGGEAAIEIPGAGGERVDPVQEISRGEAVRMAMVSETVAEIGQEIELRLLLEKRDQGLTAALGPGVTADIGDLEKRLDHVLLAWREIGREAGFLISRALLEESEILITPDAEQLAEGLMALVASARCSLSILGDTSTRSCFDTQIGGSRMMGMERSLRSWGNGPLPANAL